MADVRKFNPLVKDGFDLVNNSTGSGASIGDAVGNSPISQGILYVDSSGNLQNNALVEENGTLFGILPIQKLRSPDMNYSSMVFTDATLVGGGETIQFGSTSSGHPFGIGITDIDTFNTYLSIGKGVTDEYSFIFIPKGTGGSGSMAFYMDESGVNISNSTTFNRVLDEDDMASNASNALATQQSIKAYVDNSISGITFPVDSVNGYTGTVSLNIDDVAPDQSGNSGKYLKTDGTNATWQNLTITPGGSNTQLQYNNSGSLAGANIFYDNTKGWLGVGNTPGSPLSVLLSPGNSTTSALTVSYISQYTGGSEQAAVFVNMQTTGNTPSTAYVGASYQLQTAFDADYNASRMIGFQGLIVHQSSNGVVGTAMGGRMGVINSNTGTITAARAMQIDSLSNSSGTVTDNYGLFIDSQTAGTNNYAIYTNSGQVRFGGNLVTAAGRVKHTRRVTTTASLLTSDEVIFGNTAGGSYTVTLPAGVEGQTITIKNSGASGNTLTVAANGAESLFGVSSGTFALSDAEDIEITYNTTDGWY